MGGLFKQKASNRSVGYRESGREEARALSSSLLSWQSPFYFFFYLLSLFIFNTFHLSVCFPSSFFFSGRLRAQPYSIFVCFFNATLNQALPLLLLLV